MKDSVGRCIETFLRVQAFGREYGAGLPPDSFARQQLTVIDSVLTGLQSYTGVQAAGLSAARQSTSSKAAARAELMRDLEAISRTARAMSANNPGLLEQFRVPRNKSDQAALAAAARPLKDDFVKRGMPENFIEDLEEDAEALREAIARKIDTRDEHVTATAAIDTLIERGLDALRELDAYMRNAYANEPAGLAAWLSASRIERRTRRAQPEEEQPAPPNTPAPPAAG